MATLRVVKTPPSEMAHRAFLEAGYRIFPLWRFRDTGKDLFCECENPKCVASGKHPRASNWQHTPEWDDEQVDTMEQMGHLSGGYGVLCKGLLVIDVDARNGGIASYTKLLADFPEIAGCGFAVTTGSGGGSRHLYFSLPEIIPMVSSLPEYPGIDFKTSGFVVGPGSMHASGNRYTTDGDPSDIEPAPESIIARLRKPERHRTEYNGTSVDVSHGDIASMLDAIPNHDVTYDEWLNIGMAIHQATNGTGEALWEEWSAKSHKHDERQMAYKWHSFGRSANPVTIGTLIFHAEQNGWKMPVTFSGEDIAEVLAIDEHEPQHGLPVDISGVDLTRPPGFVGELAKWIESQSRRPRLHLSVATSLVAMGNIAGIRYVDKTHYATANLLAFCVAGSGTGKDAMNNAITAIHRVAGMAAATHGSMKSEQEIVRNLIRHQPAFYVIDEVASMLGKIANAQKKGGASYLEGVIPAVMNIFTKGNDYYIPTGDTKDVVAKDLQKEISQIEKRIEDGHGSPFLDAKLLSLQQRLSDIDNGLFRPFLSMIGYTTPVDFDEMVDFRSASNGFIGRAMIFNERDTAPRTKPNFRAPKMADPMAATIRMIASGGECDIMDSGRIEFYGDRIEVAAEPKAVEMLAAIEQWFDDQAQEHRSTSGLEALCMRCLQQVAKVSFILAIPERLKTAEHVRWAFALVRRDFEEKMRLVIGNDRAKDSPVMAMGALIENLCASDEGETLGVLLNKLRGKKREDVEKVLAELVKRGSIEAIETGRSYKGKPVERYRCARQS